MSSPLSSQDLKHIHNGIRDKYAKVAVSPEGQFKYPTGRAGLENRLEITNSCPYIGLYGNGSPSIPIFFRKRRPIHV
jgi:hypothetical protein